MFDVEASEGFAGFPCHLLVAAAAAAAASEQGAGVFVGPT